MRSVAISNCKREGLRIAPEPSLHSPVSSRVEQTGRHPSGSMCGAPHELNTPLTIDPTMITLTAHSDRLTIRSIVTPTPKALAIFVHPVRRERTARHDRLSISRNGRSLTTRQVWTLMSPVVRRDTATGHNQAVPMFLKPSSLAARRLLHFRSLFKISRRDAEESSKHFQF